LFSTPFVEVFPRSHVVLYCVERSLHKRSLIKLAIHAGTLVTPTISHYNGFFKLVEALLRIHSYTSLPSSGVTVSLHHLPNIWGQQGHAEKRVKLS